MPQIAEGMAVLAVDGPVHEPTSGHTEDDAPKHPAPRADARLARATRMVGQLDHALLPMTPVSRICCV
jgi:hypothetical protein